MWTKIKEINDILMRGEPGNITQDERHGKIFTGYTPQAVLDAVNEVMGPDGWTYTATIVTTREAEKSCHAVVKVVVQLGAGKVQREAFGEGTSPGNHGDALKAATTDALKKALGAFSVGNRAYLGLLEVPTTGNPTRASSESARDAATTEKAATEKQMNLLAALLRTVGMDAGKEVRRQHADYFAALTKNMDRGLTRPEASDAIEKVSAMGVKPTWDAVDASAWDEEPTWEAGA